MVNFKKFTQFFKKKNRVTEIIEKETLDNIHKLLTNEKDIEKVNYFFNQFKDRKDFNSYVSELKHTGDVEIFMQKFKSLATKTGLGGKYNTKIILSALLLCVTSVTIASVFPPTTFIMVLSISLIGILIIEFLSYVGYVIYLSNWIHS